MKTINGLGLNFDFIKLIKVANLIYDDDPLTYVSNKGENYLFYWVDVDNEYNRWVVIRTRDFFNTTVFRKEKYATFHNNTT